MSGISPPLSRGRNSSFLRFPAIISAVTLILLTAASTSFAQGGGPIKLLDVVFLVEGSNPCTGDVFTGTSRIMVILYPRVDGSTGADGLPGAHNTFRTLVHSQAITLGLDPRKYQGNSESTFQINEPSSGTAEFTETLNVVLVRQGEEESPLPLANDDDFMMKDTVHVTMNSNGVITAWVDNGHEKECAGPSAGPAVIIVP